MLTDGSLPTLGADRWVKTPTFSVLLIATGAHGVGGQDVQHLRELGLASGMLARLWMYRSANFGSYA